MKNHRLIGLLLGGLLLQANLLMAESVQNFPVDPGMAASGAQAWGDPEQNEEKESVWTWFGMGYEMRNQGAARSTRSPSAVSADDTSGKGGNQHGRK